MPRNQIHKIMMYVCRILYYILIIALFVALLGNCESVTETLTLKIKNYAKKSKNLSVHKR